MFKLQVADAKMSSRALPIVGEELLPSSSPTSPSSPTIHLSMDSAGSRPYRSHLFPACKVCQTRKIRCTVDVPEQPCRFCRETSRCCEYVEKLKAKADQPSTRTKRRRLGDGGRAVSLRRVQSGEQHLAPNITGTSPTESSVILDPAMAEDVEALERYLTVHGSYASDASSLAKPYRLVSSTPGKPIVYLTVPRRRKGLQGAETNPGAKNREVMEHVLGQSKQHLVDM